MDITATVAKLIQRIDEVEENLQLHAALIRGDDQLQLPGLLTRLTALEQLVKILVDKDQKRITLLRGIVIGLSITSVTSIGSFITLILQIVST